MAAPVVYDGGWKGDLIVHGGLFAKRGFLLVPDEFGLGIEFDPDVVKAHLAEGGAWRG
jgi:L-alanine-DL-glutamate epimerase-like enolase superfamily enzyme